MTPREPCLPSALTRRSFLSATAATLAASPLLADSPAATPPAPAPAPGPAPDAPQCAPACDPATLELLAKRPYITPMAEFNGFVREKPIPYEFSSEKLREVGLHRDTWRLEVLAENPKNEHVERPL